MSTDDDAGRPCEPLDTGGLAPLETARLQARGLDSPKPNTTAAVVWSRQPITGLCFRRRTPGEKRGSGQTRESPSPPPA